MFGVLFRLTGVSRGEMVTSLNQERKGFEMSDFDRNELFYAVECFLANRDGEEKECEADAVPYIQEGDVEDVVAAIEALGYKIVKE